MEGPDEGRGPLPSHFNLLDELIQIENKLWCIDFKADPTSPQGVFREEDHLCVCIHACTSRCVFVYLCVHVCVYICVCMCLCMCICVLVVQP